MIPDFISAVAACAEDETQLSEIGIDLAAAIRANANVQRVVCSALVGALSDPNVPDTTAEAVLRRIASGVQIGRVLQAGGGVV